MIQCYPGTHIFDYAIDKKIIKEVFLNNAESQKDFIINFSKMDENQFNFIKKLVYKEKFISETEKIFLTKMINKK